MKRILLGILLAILTLLAATGVGLGLIHATDFPYAADVQGLEIAEYSGLPREEIMQNYHAVMDFLSPFKTAPFHLPSLKYSETGAQHFVDCKVIFNAVYLTALVSAIAMAMLFAFKAADRKTLRYAGVFTLAIPLTLALAVAIDFDGAFVLFHKVFFQGDTWIFDPNVDEIITILPSEFFMHCALVIAASWVIAAATELIIGAKKTHYPKV